MYGTTEIKRSGWLPWSSLEMLKASSNVPIDDQGSHPGDLSDSVTALLAVCVGPVVSFVLSCPVNTWVFLSCILLVHDILPFSCFISGVCFNIKTMFKGLRPVLEGFVVPMHEGACETGSQIPRA